MTWRLLALLEHEWVLFDGWAQAQGIDVLELDIDRLLNLITWWAVKDSEDRKQTDRWLDKLRKPPSGLRKARPEHRPWSQEDERQSFKALQMATGN